MSAIQKVDDFFTVEGLKENWSLLAITGVFLLALWLRFMPANGMKYLQALDPYMIYRMSQHVALSGNLPQLDFMRYFPYATPTYLLNQGDILIPALLWWMGPFLVFNNYMAWAQFYPALMGALGVVFAYLLGREMFDKTTGVFSAFFLATIPGVMHRTSAGFFEKEPLGTALMLLSMFLFVRSWKREDYLSGIGAGITLGLFSISWGGSKMLWLLYPMVVGLVMLLDEDIEKLVTAYTPTVLIAAGVAASLNQARFWFTDTEFLVNLGMLGFLWSRYLVEKFEVLPDRQLPYYVPGMSLLGGLALLLSPLYSDYIASRVMRLKTMATQQDAGHVIAKTVAENTEASLGQLLSETGAYSAAAVNPALGALASILGSWPLSFLGIGLLASYLMLMLLRKYGMIEETVSSRIYFSSFMAVMVAWTAAFMLYFEQLAIAGFGVALLTLAVFVAMLSELEEEAVFNITALGLLFLGVLQVVAFFGGYNSALATSAPVALAIAGLTLFYMTESRGERSIEFRWYYMLPVAWFLTNVLAGVAKSRLLTLSAFPVAFIAGYTFATLVKKVKSYDFGTVFEELDGGQVKAGVLTAVIGLALLVNGAAGYVSVQRVSGSPSPVWYDSLNYMQKQTDPGDVVMSWWDYGYWFESIGRRAAVADGGNMGYYTPNPLGKVNYPLADFFTTSNPANYTWFLEKHSVDYILLDHSMIGKYAAVSQISHKSATQYSSMLTISTAQDIRKSLSQGGNQTVVEFSGRGLKIYAPISRKGQDIVISGPPTFQTSQGRLKINCVLTDSGRKTFNSSQESQFCVSEDPFYSLESAFASLNTQNPRPASIVLVPQKISRSTLVRLYLQDGYGVELAEKIPEASNGYVKIWKVKDLK
ncbi:MAG: STT3 domain-containing protein [Candidatus Nanohaloarchaea archaeon]